MRNQNDARINVKYFQWMQIRRIVKKRIAKRKKFLNGET